MHKLILTWMGSVMGNLSLSCNIIRVILLLSLFASFSYCNREERYVRSVFSINVTSMALPI